RSGLLALLPLLSFSSPSSALAPRPQEKAQDKAQELPSAREIVDRYATVAGYDGKVAWMVQPMVGPRILTGTELMTTRIEAVYDGALKTSDRYESMKTVGK